MSESEWIHSAVVIVETIARALDHLHAQGILHRDVKPGNIIIDCFGDAWLADFGLVRDFDAPTLEAEGILGTVQYISPEQIEGTQGETDCRSDLYALGVTLYELVTLSRPFDGGDPASILHVAAREPPRPPRGINPRLTVGFERVIQKAMAKDPAARYQSGSALADDLRRLRTREQDVASRVPDLAARPRVGRGAPVLVGAIVLLVVVVLGLSAYCVQGALRERQRLLDCRADADSAFDRGDYRVAAEGYRLYRTLGGSDSAVLPRLRACEGADAFPASK